MTRTSNILAALFALTAIGFFVAWINVEEDHEKAPQTAAATDVAPPVVGDTFTVDLHFAGERHVHNSPMGAADQANYVRDLLLRAAVTRLASGEDTVRALHDLNGPRQRYLNTTTNPQYGAVRYAPIGDDAAVLLVPHAAEVEEIHDWVAQAADQLHLSLGRPLARLFVLEYCVLPSAVNPEKQFATLDIIRIESEDALYSSSYGFHSQSVATEAELNAALTQIDDVIEVRGDGASMIVAGRDYQARDYGQLSAEHIATLSQAYKEIEAASERADRALNNLFVDTLIEQFSVRYPTAQIDRSGLFGGTAEQSQYFDLLQEEVSEALGLMQEVYGTCVWENIRIDLRDPAGGQFNLSPIHRDMFVRYGQTMAARSLQEESLQRGAIGFSLDTDYDFDRLHADMTAFFATTWQPEHPVEPIEFDTLMEIAVDLEQFSPIILEQLLAKNADTLLCLLDGYGRGPRELLENHLLGPSEYQIARYDGGIQGTEVGQVLFLTDLLAKLMDFNFNGVFDVYHPDGVPGWMPASYVMPPEMYLAQMDEMPGTRLWFDLRPGAAYDISSNGTRFPADATRVFALAQDSLSGETERQPGWLSELSTSWLNHNYDVIAADEPAFDQLNQIVKWAYALDRLGQRGSPRFLSQVSVSRDHYFPDWVQEREVTGADTWVSCFHVRNSRHSSLETMPVFHVNWPTATKDWCNGAATFQRLDEYISLPSRIALLPTPLAPVALRDLLAGFRSTDNRVFAFRGGVSLPRALDAGALRHSFSRGIDVPVELRRMSTLKGTVRGDGAGGFGYNRIPENNRVVSLDVSFAPDGFAARVDRSAAAVTRERTGEFVETPELSVFNRGLGTEIRVADNVDLVDLASIDAGRMTIRTEMAGLPVETVSIRTGTDVVSVEARAEALQMAEAIGQRLSRMPQENWYNVLRAELQIEAMHLTSQNTVLMRLNGSWVELRGASAAAPEVSPDFAARISATRDNSNLFDAFRDIDPVEIRAVGPDAVAERIGVNKGLSFNRIPREDGSFLIDVRGPPRPPIDPPEPVSAAASPGPPQGGMTLLIGRRESDGQLPILDLRFEAPDLGRGQALDRIIDFAGRGAADLPASTPPSRYVSLLPRPNVDFTAYASRFQDAAEMPISRQSIDFMAQLRSDMLGDARLLLEAGDAQAGQRLLNDLQARFGALTPAENLTMARARSAASDAMTARVFDHLESGIAAGASPRDIARGLLNDMGATFREDPSMFRQGFQGPLQDQIASRLTGLAFDGDTVSVTAQLRDAAQPGGARLSYVDTRASLPVEAAFGERLVLAGGDTAKIRQVISGLNPPRVSVNGTTFRVSNEGARGTESLLRGDANELEDYVTTLVALATGTAIPSVASTDGGAGIDEEEVVFISANGELEDDEGGRVICNASLGLAAE